MLRLVLMPMLWFIERYTFGYATHINVVSEGFRPYFKPFTQATYSSFTNGIDNDFLDFTSPERQPVEDRIILYAGNIGEGQGLHKIIPQAARLLGNAYRFIVIGDGGARAKLQKSIRTAGITNVELRPPMSRKKLIQEYGRADYLFAHLNDLDAFGRVLPSKLFEYGATDKPILAGVAGYSASFIRQHIANSLLFAPGDVDGFVTQLRQMPYRTQHRPDFVRQFRRETIMQKMAWQIRQTIPPVTTVSIVGMPGQSVPATA